MYDEEYKKLLDTFNKSIYNYIEEKDEPIYHYTSPDGLNAIISNSTLRFTDRNYLNDYTEGRYIMKLCLDNDFTDILPDEYIGKFKSLCNEFYNNPLKKKVPTFQCSFSTGDDLLPMWNYYSKNDGIKGYNVGFASNVLVDNIKTCSYKQNSSSDNGLKISGGEVVYDKDNQIKIIKKVMCDYTAFLAENTNNTSFYNLVVELLVDKLLFVGSFFKAECFNYEKEYRLLITPRMNPVTQEYCVLEKEPKTVTKNGLIIPIIDLEFKKSVLESIKVSPTLDYKEAKSSLRNALRNYSYQYDEIKITSSDIPVRY